MPPEPTPALVTLTVWGVPPRRIPAAVAAMALDRRHLHGPGAPRFAKLLGTGDGRTFTLKDADPRHWALLATWDDAAAADAFAAGPLHRAWTARAEETLDVRLEPLASRGRWSRRTPFGDPTPKRTDGPVAAITRARLSPGRARTFWRAVPPVSADIAGDIAGAAAPALAIGIGEAPIGLQGTFSLWRSTADLVAFARRPAHAEVVARTPREGWYAEELFARFVVLQVRGTFAGRTVVL